MSRENLIRQILHEGLNLFPKSYVVKWLEFPTGNRPYGGGGWSKNAKYKPMPEVRSVITSDIHSKGKSIYVNGIRKLKLNIWEKDGTPIRIDYHNIQFDTNQLSEGINLPKMTPQSWFQSILNRTTGPYTTPDYPNSLFYKLDGDVIFEYDQETGDFWVGYDAIWSVFEDRFGVEYDETQELIKSMVEEHYKLGSVTPMALRESYWLGWKNITNWGQ